MTQNKKFISPQAWFSMMYPMSWSEFEDGEGSFLFYNPNEWNGNFRISAFRGGSHYGSEAVRQELKENPSASATTIGDYSCAYSREMFEEGGDYYTSHLWIVGIGSLAFECSFTVGKGGSTSQAETIISSIEVRQEGIKYPAEIIPVRLSEIYQINEAFEWATNTVKEQLKKDFQGAESDLENLQKIIDSAFIAPKKKEAWLALGITLCVILANEVDGLEWMTLIDGNREAPILQNATTSECIDPMKLVWSKVKAGQAVNLVEIYQNIL